MRKAENVGLTTIEPDRTFQEMMIAIWNSLSDLASSDDGEDREDEDAEETEQGQLSEDDEPGWVMGTISKTVQQWMGRFQQKQMKRDELTYPRLEDAVDYFSENDMQCGTSELTVPAITIPQIHNDGFVPTPTIFGEHAECQDIGPGRSQMPEGTS